VHRLLRKCTVQSTERAKIFVEKFFALEVGLGREELQGIKPRLRTIFTKLAAIANISLIFTRQK